MNEATIKILYNLVDENMVKSSPHIRLFALSRQKHIKCSAASYFGFRAIRFFSFFFSLRRALASALIYILYYIYIIYYIYIYYIYIYIYKTSS